MKLGSWAVRYEAGGQAALKDRRVGASHRRAPPEEVAALEALYGDGCRGWNMRHFHEEVYVREHGGSRSYTWVKNRLQEAGLVRKGRRKGPHRERPERKPAAGTMLHQDASTHAWVPGEQWDLVVTMDDATGEVHSGFFVAQEGTWSSLRGVRETVEAKGLFDSLYTDRGSHCWYTPEAGGKVDKDSPTQFGRAMAELGGRKLQIPPQRHRCHYVRAKVQVHEYEDGATAVFHGMRKLGRYDAGGRLLDRAAAAA